MAQPQDLLLLRGFGRALDRPVRRRKQAELERSYTRAAGHSMGPKRRGVDTCLPG